MQGAKRRQDLTKWILARMGGAVDPDHDFRSWRAFVDSVGLALNDNKFRPARRAVNTVVAAQERRYRANPLRRPFPLEAACERVWERLLGFPEAYQYARQIWAAARAEINRRIKP